MTPEILEAREIVPKLTLLTVELRQNVKKNPNSDGFSD